MIDLRTISDRAAVRAVVRYLVSRRVGKPDHELQPASHRLIARVFNSIDHGDDLQELRLTLAQCLASVTDAQMKLAESAALAASGEGV